MRNIQANLFAFNSARTERERICNTAFHLPVLLNIIQVRLVFKQLHTKLGHGVSPLDTGWSSAVVCRECENEI